MTCGARRKPTQYPRTAARFVLVQLRRRSEPRKRARGLRPVVYMMLRYTVAVVLGVRS